SSSPAVGWSPARRPPRAACAPPRSTRPTGTGTPQVPPSLVDVSELSRDCRRYCKRRAGPGPAASAALGRRGGRRLGGLGGRRAVAVLGVAARAAPAQAVVEDAGDRLLGALGQVVRLVGGGDLVVGVLVVAVLVVDAVGDAVRLVLVEAGVGHGVDDVAPLGVVARAGGEPEDESGCERGELETTGHGAVHLG